MHTNERHANYLTCDLPEGGTITFRAGQPTDLVTAINRHYERLDKSGVVIRYMRRQYRVRFAEVRATDKHGRGLGSERHSQAIAIPYKAVVA